VPRFELGTSQIQGMNANFVALLSLATVHCLVTEFKEGKL